MNAEYRKLQLSAIDLCGWIRVIPAMIMLDRVVYASRDYTRRYLDLSFRHLDTPAQFLASLEQPSRSLGTAFQLLEQIRGSNVGSDPRLYMTIHIGP